MAHGKNYHGKPHHNTPPSRQPKTTATTGHEQAQFANFTAALYLNNHVGGKWSLDQTAHVFYADFHPKVAYAITEYFRPFDVALESKAINPAGQTRITMTLAQYVQIEQIDALKKEKSSLAQQYQAQLSKGRGV